MKTRLDLLPVGSLKETADAFASGATKYEAWAWRNGRPYSHHVAAMLRHIFEWLDGKDKDDDSGIHPLAHAASRAMILMEFTRDKRFRKFDDRGKAKKGPTREA